MVELTIALFAMFMVFVGLWVRLESRIAEHDEKLKHSERLIDELIITLDNWHKREERVVIEEYLERVFKL